MSDKSDVLIRDLRAFGLTYPGTHIKSPWEGHADLAVNDKTFAYVTQEGDPFRVSFKLPFTGEGALEESWAQPSAYGLGKSGWVTMTPSDDELPSLDQFKAWLDESYRAQAPKKLVKQLGPFTP